MSSRALILGLDGADLDVIESLGPETLPTLYGLMQSGASGRSRSVLPAATLPNWLTFLTGMDPGAHGVFDFATRRGYRVRFTGGTLREAPLVVERMDAAGLSCACLSFPGTWPPPRLARGAFISGWDSPVSFEANASFVWPPRLHGEIRDRFGTLRFDDVDELAADSPGWLERLPDALCARAQRKCDVAEWLLARQPWDAFFAYFGESDTAAHYLWPTHDRASPRWTHTQPTCDGVARVYAALDACVARLLRVAGPETELTLVSDHGSGGTSDKVLYLNRVLEAAGLLTFSRRARRSHLSAAHARTTLPGLLPSRLRQWVFEAFGRALPNRLESWNRFGAIDMAKTVAFSDEINYFPAIHLNLRGRDPLGRLELSRAGVVRKQIECALGALTDPWTRRPVVRAVHAREELYAGPFVGRAPDLILELELDARYSYNLLPSSSAPAETSPWRRLDPSELRPRKGRGLVGSHRDHGVWIVHGPRVAASKAEARTRFSGAALADATSTLLARLDLNVPEELTGRVRWELLRPPDRRDGLGLPRIPAHARPADPAAERHIRRRLRALGYLE